MEEIKVIISKNDMTEQDVENYKKEFEILLNDYNRNGNFVYVKFTRGQYKDSIAKLVSDTPPEFTIQRNNYNFCYYGGIYYSGVCKWDGRKNKPQGSLYELVWLKDYVGETKWVSVSAEEAKTNALKQDVLDIDDNVLNIGDEVLYINARYGCGMTLCFGIIDRFEAEYHKGNNTVTVSTIVKLKSDLAEESRILNPESFIYKLQDKE